VIRFLKKYLSAIDIKIGVVIVKVAIRYAGRY
jgi:hypothetical protein